MAEVELRGPIRKVGNSLAILIPAGEARRAHLSEGVQVHASISTEFPEPLGLLKGVAQGRFERQREGLWHDRI